MTDMLICEQKQHSIKVLYFTFLFYTSTHYTMEGNNVLSTPLHSFHNFTEPRR